MSTSGRSGDPATSLDDGPAVPSPPGESRLRARMRILSGSRVFAALPSHELERLAAVSVLRRLRPNEYLTHSGEEVKILVVVGRGRLKVVLPTPETGSDFLLGIFTAGDVFGEIGLFENSPRVGSHVAIESSEAVLVPKDDLLALIDRQPQVAMRLLEVLATKLRLAMGLGLALHSLDLPARFYRRLLYFSETNSCEDGDGIRIEHGLSQRDLAISIGVTREALNRLMAEWKQAGLIDYGRGFVRIPDPEALLQALPPSAQHGSLRPGSH